jgi:hypothetical protein
MRTMWDKIATWIMFAGMPLVTWYHAFTENIFLNTAATDARGLEWVGNEILSPAQFLLGGKIAIQNGEKYSLELRFNYHNYLPWKSVASILSLPIALPIGSLIKGLSYFSPTTQDHHQKILAAQSSNEVVSNLPLYKVLGLPLSDESVLLDPPAYQRRPGEENHLLEDKELLRDIAQILKENQIPFWLDVGSCLGAYRYGGVIPWDIDCDVAILLPDFQNVRNALKKLDPTKYVAQDWSSRCHPKSHIRVYVYATRNHLDIYCFAIDPEKKTLTWVFANGDSSFMTEAWKIRERRFAVPSAYETVFPLKKALFDGIEVFVPNQTKKYLQERYGDDISPAKIYNPATDTYENVASHPYWTRAHAH